MRPLLGALFAWLLSTAAARAQASEPPEDAPAAASAPEAGPPPSKEAIAAAEARHAGEPSVDSVVQATLLAAPPPRALALAARARLAGLMPRIGFRIRRGQTVDLSAPQSLDADALRVRSNDDITLEATLSFELERVIFRREEVALLHQSALERGARDRMVREVIALYFERRRLQLERDLHGDAALARGLRIAEIEALLDIFTNGAFRRMIAKPGWTTAASTRASSSR